MVRRGREDGGKREEGMIEWGRGKGGTRKRVKNQISIRH